MLTILRKVTLYGTALFILLFILSILVAMVVDLLFPGTTDVVANLSRLINQFIDAGLVGLVTFHRHCRPFLSSLHRRCRPRRQCSPDYWSTAVGTSELRGRRKHDQVMLCSEPSARPA